MSEEKLPFPKPIPESDEYHPELEDIRLELIKMTEQVHQLHQIRNAEKRLYEYEIARLMKKIRNLMAQQTE